jgi:hypothetical protein
MWNKILTWVRNLFSNQTIKDLATVGVTIGLVKYPYMKEPIIKTSQYVVDTIDGKGGIDINSLDVLLMKEFDKAKLSTDQRLIGTAAIALYKPKLISYLNKIAPIDEMKKMQELRALAVLVNQAAGGVAT